MAVSTEVALTMTKLSGEELTFPVSLATNATVLDVKRLAAAQMGCHESGLSLWSEGVELKNAESAVVLSSHRLQLVVRTCLMEVETLGDAGQSPVKCLDAMGSGGDVLLVAGHEDGRVWLHGAKGQCQKLVSAHPPHRSSVNALRLLDNGGSFYMLSGCNDGRIILWSLGSSGKREIICRRHFAAPNSKDVPTPDTILGQVYEDRGLGRGSYHFVSDNEQEQLLEAYISYEDVGTGGDAILLDDGSWPPPRIPFTEFSYDPDTRTFKGTVDWAPGAMGGAQQQRYTIVFSENVNEFASASVEHFRPGSDEPERLDLFEHHKYKRWGQHTATISMQVNSLQVSKDNRQIVSLATYGNWEEDEEGNESFEILASEVELWNALGERKYKVPGVSEENSAEIAIAFAHGQGLATLIRGHENGSVHAWDVATATSVTSLAGHKAGVSVATVSQDGQLVATGGKDGECLIQEPRGALRHRFNVEAPVVGVAFCGEALVVVTAREVQVWSDGSLLAKASPVSDGEVAFTSIAVVMGWVDEGYSVGVGATDGTIRLFTLVLPVAGSDMASTE